MAGNTNYTERVTDVLDLRVGETYEMTIGHDATRKNIEILAFSPIDVNRKKYDVLYRMENGVIGEQTLSNIDSAASNIKLYAKPEYSNLPPSKFRKFVESNNEENIFKLLSQDYQKAERGIQSMLREDPAPPAKGAPNQGGKRHRRKTKKGKSRSRRRVTRKY